MEVLSNLGQYLYVAFVFLLMLTILVIVHELGHYLVARMFGMHINAFAVMMGGVRKTDLRDHLKSPIMPVKNVWLIAFGVFVLALVFAFLKSDPLYFASIAALGIGVPVWVMLRQGALYHVPAGKVWGTWMKSQVVAAVVVAFGTKLQGIDMALTVYVSIAATLIALMMNYYLPVMAREPDDDKQGQGHIEVEDDAFGKKTIDVRFRPIWHRTDKHGTEYSLLLLPLGGFAAIKGMHAKPDGSEVNVEKGFYSKPAWQRLLVLFAGPLFSVVFGLIILTAMFSTVGEEVPDKAPVIGFVMEESPAAGVGLLEGDRILEIDGVEIDSFYDLVLNVRDNWYEDENGKNVGTPITLVYERGGEESTVTFVPNVDEEPEPIRDEDLNVLVDEKAVQARMGVGFQTKYEHMSLGSSVSKAVMFPVDMVVGLANVAAKPSTAKDSIAGPTVIVQVTNIAVNEGIYYVLRLAALLSISLGVMNLLPVVPLDGGQMVIAFIEMFKRGKRLAIGIQHFLTNAGLAFIVLLMLSVFAIDIGRRADANQKKTEVSGSKQDEVEPEEATEQP